LKSRIFSSFAAQKYTKIAKNQKKKTNFRQTEPTVFLLSLRAFYKTLFL